MIKLSFAILATGWTVLGCHYTQGLIELTFLPNSFPSFLRTISTFGLMLALAFLAGNYIIQREFFRLNIDRKIGDNLVIIGVVAGIVGSKLFFMFEIWNRWSTPEQFIKYALEGAGLVWYGGFILAGGIIAFYIRRKGLGFLRMADVLTPVIAIGHGIGRLGCLFSGDGCYGTVCPYNWPAPFAMAFENGAAPWGETIGRIGREMGQYIDPTTAVVYNTPLFEAVFGIGLFVFYWLNRKKEWPTGFKFVSFVMAHVTLRFLVEYIRLNKFEFFGLFTQAQLLGLIAFLGCIGFFIYRRQDLITVVKSRG